jgi:hypothetical protein
MAQLARLVVRPDDTQDDDETGNYQTGDDDPDSEMERIIRGLPWAGRTWLGDKVSTDNVRPVDHQRQRGGSGSEHRSCQDGV